MSFSPCDSAEFAKLIHEGVIALAWERGELEFGEEDIREIRNELRATSDGT